MVVGLENETIVISCATEAFLPRNGTGRIGNDFEFETMVRVGRITRCRHRVAALEHIICQNTRVQNVTGRELFRISLADTHTSSPTGFDRPYDVRRTRKTHV